MTYLTGLESRIGCVDCNDSTSGVCLRHSSRIIVYGLDGQPLCAACGRQRDDHRGAGCPVVLCAREAATTKGG